MEAAPALEHAPLAETWSGLRPGTPDGFPILGADPEIPNLVYATGHFRNGILLAPLTGERVGALLSHGEWCADVRPFHVARFGEIAGYHSAHQPPALVLWGRHDAYFDVDEVLAYHRALDRMDAHIYDGGHLLLETHAAECAALMRAFVLDNS